MSVVCNLLAVLCVLYFICLIAYCGFSSNFFFCWLVLGVIWFLLGVSVRKHWISTYLPTWMQKSVLVGVLLAAFLFVFVEALVFSGYQESATQELDYVVVLGAGVKETGPSKVLRYRLDRAYECYKADTDVILIVSGGQGSNEPETEAAVMERYLVEKGIPKNQILQENQSINTNQNLLFSRELMEADSRVGIVSNNFHLFRAVHIARKAGYEQVWGIPAKSDPITQPNNLLREFFGVIKDFIFGNMG